MRVSHFATIAAADHRKPYTSSLGGTGARSEKRHQMSIRIGLGLAYIMGPGFAIGALTAPNIIAVCEPLLNANSGQSALIMGAPDDTFRLVHQVLLTAAVCIALGSAALAIYPSSIMRRLLHLFLFGILLELFYRFAYDGPISPGLLLSVPETSQRETLELLAGHTTLTWSLSLVMVLAIVSLIVSWRGHPQIRARVRLPAGCLAASLLAASLIWGSLQLGGLRASARESLLELADLFPFDLANALLTVAREWTDTRGRASNRDSFRFPNANIVDGATRHEREIYVIVVGETSRRANWSLFGYSRQTTPRLDATKEDLIVFNHVTANATNTILSLPLALTRASAANRGALRSEKSIVALLRQTGFQTFWLSNQERSDVVSNPITQIALDAESVSFTADMPTSERDQGLDSNLVTRLDELINRLPEGGKLAIVLHMEGSHFGYKNRYPENFEHFVNRKEEPLPLHDWQRRLVDEYDNSILYTDDNLRAMIDRLAMCHCKAGLIFFSDHGERLFDHGPSDTQFGHGFPQVSRQEIEIPFFVWLSSAYRSSNTLAVAHLQANTQSTAQLHNLFETIVDLAGVSYDGRSPELSLFSDQFAPPEALEVLNLQERLITLPIHE